MKKFLVMAILGLAGFAALGVGSCPITSIDLLSTDGVHITFAGQLQNNSSVNILGHNFIVAFLDVNNNVVETKTVGGCLRSVQNGSTDFFSAVSNNNASGISTGLARLAFDSAFKVGTTSSENVSITNIAANRNTTNLTVTGKITNNAGTSLVSPNVCIVIRTAAGNVLITANTTTGDIGAGSNATFASGTITVPNSSTASTVDIWVDGLDASSNPTTPQSALGTGITIGGTATKLGFSVQPVGGVLIATNFGTMPIVKILDVNGNIVTTGSGSTLNVTLAVKAGTAPAGTVLACDNNTVAAVAGLASFTNCKLNHAAAAIVLTATSGALTSADSTGIAINPGAAATLAFSTNPAGATGGVAFLTQPVVVVQDAIGDTVWTGTNSTAAITLTKHAAGSPAGTLAGCTAAVAAVAGVATFGNCSFDVAGAGYSLDANGGAPALTQGTSGTFTVSVGAAAKLAINQPSNALSGAVFAPTQPIVTVQDAGGNTVTTSVAPITLTSSLGVLACTTNPIPAVAGVAAFAGCKITGAAIMPTITAASAGLTSATTAAITIT